MIFTLNGTELEFDLLTIDRDLNAIERKVGLKESTPTPQLLDALSAWLTLKGVASCTRSMAWQVWWAIYERMDKLRKQYEVNSELAFWFHVDPFKLSDFERIGLLANMDRCKAQGLLHHGKFNPLDYEGVYNLVLLATGDEAKARSARADAMERYVDARTKGR